MRTLCRDERGSTMVEFAIVAPILLFAIMGGLELGYNAYVTSALMGELQRAGRNSTLETASATEQKALLEGQVRTMVRKIAPNGTVTFTRKAYHDYADIQAPYEKFNDENGSGTCDANEVYMDSNGNGTWDRDAGTADSDGGAKDIVVYTAQVDYPRLPVGRLVGLSERAQITARTAFRNQPFDQQRTVVERSCRP